MPKFPYRVVHTEGGYHVLHRITNAEGMWKWVADLTKEEAELLERAIETINEE